jgi:DNA segregation ATPase FtsK/SpoIIIE, S-DNA-T family
VSSRRRKKTLLAAVLAGGGTAYVASHYHRKTAKTRSWFRAAAEWRTQAFVFVGFCYLWGKTGSLIAAALLTALLAGGGVSAWYWWRHKKTGISYRDAARQMRQRKSLEQKWNHAILEGTSFVKAGGTVPPLKNVTFDAGDITARVYTGSYAIATDKFAPHLPLIAEVVGCRDIRYTSPAPGVMDLRFCFSDPLEQVVKPSDLKPIKPGIAPFGLTDRGDVIGLPVLNKDGEAIFTPLLIGGVSGSGKSSDVWSLLAGLIVAQIPVRLRVIDPAGGVELAALGEAYERGLGTDLFRVHRYTDSAAGAEAIIKEIRGALDGRLRSMKAKGVRLHKPTIEEPLDLLLTDELLLLGKLLKEGVHGDMGQVKTVGRKAGFSEIACTQIGEKVQLGPMRELYPRRKCFRTNTREQTETILGSGGRADQAPAHRISDSTPGVGYSYDDTTGRMLKYRAAYFTDAQCQQIAQGEIPAGMEHFITPPEVIADHAVYRLWGFPDRQGARALLYVGETNEPRRRFEEHQREKEWKNLVDWGWSASRVAWYPSKAEAKKAQDDAIRAELPLRNKILNGDNPALTVVEDVA